MTSASFAPILPSHWRTGHLLPVNVTKMQTAAPHLLLECELQLQELELIVSLFDSSVRCPLPHDDDNCFTYFTFGFGATGPIYNVYNTTGSFAFMAKTLLQAGTGRKPVSETLLFSLQPLTINSVVNLENQNWGNISKQFYENFGFGVSGCGMWRGWLELWVQMYSLPRGASKALPPSCVRVSHIVSEYRPLFFSIAPRVRVSPLGDEV